MDPGSPLVVENMTLKGFDKKRSNAPFQVVVKYRQTRTESGDIVFRVAWSTASGNDIKDSKDTVLFEAEVPFTGVGTYELPFDVDDAGALASAADAAKPAPMRNDKGGMMPAGSEETSFITVSMLRGTVEFVRAAFLVSVSKNGMRSYMGLKPRVTMLDYPGSSGAENPRMSLADKVRLLKRRNDADEADADAQTVAKLRAKFVRKDKAAPMMPPTDPSSAPIGARSYDGFGVGAVAVCNACLEKPIAVVGLHGGERYAFCSASCSEAFCAH